jgi:hypothetical protein
LGANNRPPPRGVDHKNANGQSVAASAYNTLKSQNALSGNAVERTAQLAFSMSNDAPHGKCAGYVVSAIEKGLGKSIGRPAPTVGSFPSAKDFGPSLTRAGYQAVPNPSQPRVGDVQVIQGVHGHPDGHMQIYTAQGWVSDFNQGVSSVQNPKSAYYGQPTATYRME